MEHLESLYWKRAGSGLSLGIDFKSIETEGRVVTGFATLDNVDFADDIVPLEASIRAFENFRGNIRAQHDKNQPVGKLLGFEVAEFFDEKTQQSFKGIKVAVYVSKGAPHIWEMVQDGTLSAFSIGAAVKEASRVYKEDLKKTVQVIKDYVLLELSLVDSPMNQLANTEAVYKAFGVEDTEIEKDFSGSHLMWCATDRISTKSQSPAMSCPICSEPMGNLGHIEENTDIGEQLTKVFNITQKGGHPQVAENIVNEENNEEVVTPEATVVETEAVEEVALEETDETPAEESEVESSEEAVAEVDTTEASAPVLDPNAVQEVLDQLRDVVRSEFELALTASNERIEAVAKSVESLQAEVLKAFGGVKEEVNEKLASLGAELSETKESLGVVTNNLDELVAEPAVKKSLDSVHTRTDDTRTNEDELFKGFFSEGLF